MFNESKQKKILVFYRLALCVVAMTFSNAVAAGWDLIWSDEFNYEGLPDNSKWSYEEGFIRKGRRQIYTHARRENTRVENGVLVIEARRERFPNAQYEESSNDWRKLEKFAEYTSGSIHTKGKFAWQYGRIEMRAIQPQGKGTWSAFWTLGANRDSVGWPRSGEIDIMEFVGRFSNSVYANAHYFVNGEHQEDEGKIEANDLSSNFHIYAIEWYPDRIDFFLDDKKYHTFQIDKAAKEGEDNEFRQPHFILVNLALGGKAGGPIDDSIFPQKYILDYVRIYQHNNDQEE